MSLTARVLRSSLTWRVKSVLEKLSSKRTEATRYRSRVDAAASSSRRSRRQSEADANAIACSLIVGLKMFLWVCPPFVSSPITFSDCNVTYSDDVSSLKSLACRYISVWRCIWVWCLWSSSGKKPSSSGLFKYKCLKPVLFYCGFCSWVGTNLWRREAVWIFYLS